MSCWQLGELAGLQRFIVARLGDPEAIVVLDETAERPPGWTPPRARPCTSRRAAIIEPVFASCSPAWTVSCTAATAKATSNRPAGRQPQPAQGHPRSQAHARRALTA